MKRGMLEEINEDLSEVKMDFAMSTEGLNERHSTQMDKTDRNVQTPITRIRNVRLKEIQSCGTSIATPKRGSMVNNPQEALNRDTVYRICAIRKGPITIKMLSAGRGMTQRGL